MSKKRFEKQHALYLPLGILVLICTFIEGILLLADWGFFGASRLRSLAYENAGYWPGLLQSWLPNYTGQEYLMFLTYGFLHTGPVHLTVNMVTLYSLGRAVLDRVGICGFLALYTVALVGGAIGYSLIFEGAQPMIGASGALFGLAGGLLAWMYIDRFTFRLSLLPIVQGVFLLIVLNVFMWFITSGQIAWETHLGGFLSGWITATLIDPRSIENDNNQDLPGEDSDNTNEQF